MTSPTPGAPLLVPFLAAVVVDDLADRGADIADVGLAEAGEHRQRDRAREGVGAAQ